MAADLLQLQHHRREPLGRRLPPLDPPRNVEVLAKDAAQIAAGEEDRAGAVPAAEAVLLAEVRKMGGDDRVAADPAQSALVPEAVHGTQPGTHSARRTQQPQRTPRPLRKLARALKGNIGGRAGAHRDRAAL
jgi:hypothetical protein